MMNVLGLMAIVMVVSVCVRQWFRCLYVCIVRVPFLCVVLNMVSVLAVRVTVIGLVLLVLYLL